MGCFKETEKKMFGFEKEITKGDVGAIREQDGSLSDIGKPLKKKVYEE